MKTKILSLLSLLLALVTSRAAVTAFMYQGRLNDGGSPANGNYDFTFQLFDAAANGNAVANAVTNPAVAVSNGVFSVEIDFGASVFDGNARWIEIGVRTNGSASAFTLLSPRQPVTPTPYAIYAYSAGTAALVPAANLSGTIPLSQLPGTLLTNGQNGVVLNGTFVGNGGGLTNIGVGGTINWQVVSGTNVQTAPGNGYLTLADSPVTLTLPASPNVGDVIRVAGSGGGGWRIAQNFGQSILINSKISSSYTNYSWSTNNLPRAPLADYLASSGDGSKLIAASTNGHLYTSSDFGGTWTERATNLNNPYWRGVATSADGTKLVAIVYGGQIYTSGDSGANWTARATIQNWSGVASAADGTNLVGVVNGGKVYLSTDAGVNWNLSPTPFDGDDEPWTAAASSADGTKLFVARGNPLGGVDRSTNAGASLQILGVSGNGVFDGVDAIACSADGTKVFANWQSGILSVSYDSGLTWANRTVSANGLGHAIACSADGTRVIVVTYYSIKYSFDSGLTWYFHGDPNFGYDSPSDQAYWTAIALSADGTKAAIAKDFFNAGTIYPGWDFATRPGAAGYLVGTQYSAVELLYVGGGEFLPVSFAGTLIAH